MGERADEPLRLLAGAREGNGQGTLPSDVPIVDPRPAGAGEDERSGGDSVGEVGRGRAGGGRLSKLLLFVWTWSSTGMGVAIAVGTPGRP